MHAMMYAARICVANLVGWMLTWQLIITLHLYEKLEWRETGLFFFPSLLFTFSFFLLCVSVICFPVHINLSFLFNTNFHSHMSTEKAEILVVRLNCKNYSTWALHFDIFVTWNDLSGHVDGSTPFQDKFAHAK
jgi:hypothetical protein